MPKGYMIEKIEDANVFVSRMRSFDENSIECTPHTLFRLSEGQRKVFIIKIIVSIKPTFIRIVTFMIVAESQIPK